MANKYWVHLANGETKVMHSIGSFIDDIPVVGHHLIPEKVADKVKADDEKDVAQNEKETSANE